MDVGRLGGGSGLRSRGGGWGGRGGLAEKAGAGEGDAGDEDDLEGEKKAVYRFADR